MTYNNEVPHLSSLANERRDCAASGTKQHQFDWLVVHQIIENFHAESWLTLQSKHIAVIENLSTSKHMVMSNNNNNNNNNINYIIYINND